MECNGLKVHELVHRSKMLRMALEGLSFSSEESKINSDDIHAVYMESIRIEKDLESLFAEPDDLKLAA